MNVVTGTLAKMMGCNSNERAPLITEAELRTILNVSHEEGVLEQEERTMMDNVVNFGDAKARDAMTPRTDILAVSTKATYAEFVEVVRRKVFPVCLYTKKIWTTLLVSCMSKMCSWQIRRTLHRRNI